MSDHRHTGWDQPGLEADHRDVATGLHPVQPGLEVIHPDTPKEAYQVDHTSGLELTDSSSAETHRKRRVRPLWIVLGVVGLLVVVGAVVGGVVGSRTSTRPEPVSAAPSATPSADPAKPSSPSADPSKPLENIMPNSRLSVAGWRAPDNSSAYHIRLFYQGPDQKIRFSKRADTDKDWEAPYVLGNLAYKPKNNTQIAATVSVEDKENPQWKLFYLEPSFRIRNQVFNEKDASPDGVGSPFNDFEITVAPTSRLSAHWPLMLSQREDGTLLWTRYWGIHSEHEMFEEQQQNATLTAAPGSDFVAIPGKAVYLAGGGILYRRADGRLSNYLQNNNTVGTTWAYGDASQFLLPDETSMGGFILAETTERRDEHILTYVVYQDEAGVLQMVWQDRDKEDWQGPKTFSAFDGADVGTDIACATAAAWDSSGVRVSDSDSLARCFFQVNGRVREVHWNAAQKTWKDEGFLPID